MNRGAANRESGIVGLVLLAMSCAAGAEQYRSEVRELDSAPQQSLPQDPQKQLQITTDPYAKALLLRESAKWMIYDVPEAQRPAHWKGRWHGQAQKWFALAFTGTDADIAIDAHDREFEAWRWVPAHDLPSLIVPFKRPVYEAVLKEFADLVA